MIINGKYYESVKVDSPEFKALMTKWSNEAWNEETKREFEEYQEKEALK